MPAYFIESSAFVKRFSSEKGSKFVLDLFRPSAANRFYSARITEVEVCAAIVRRSRNTSSELATKAIKRLRREFSSRLTHIALSDAVIEEAIRLTSVYGLRGYDAVQLSAALTANRERLSHALTALTLISSDTELNSAAIAEGLFIEDPNDHL